jgi:hypothetical protein
LSKKIAIRKEEWWKKGDIRNLGKKNRVVRKGVVLQKQPIEFSPEKLGLKSFKG